MAKPRPARVSTSPHHVKTLHTITYLHPLYTLFFLHLEPLSTIVGAIYALFLPSTYLSLTTPLSPPPTPVPLSTTIALAQLANLYLLFCINEALVLRSTRDVRVWRTLLFGLLIADVGHLASVSGLGWRKYWDVWGWNAMDGGNLGFVYAGMAMRSAFLMGWGLNVEERRVVDVDVRTKEE